MANLAQETSRDTRNSHMSTIFSSLSPLDSQPVWRGPATATDEIAAVMARAAEASRSWRRRPLAKRSEIIRRYGRYLQQNRTEIQRLITREVGKLPWDAAAEVTASIAKIETSLRALETRRSGQGEPAPPRDPASPPPSPRRQIRYRPLGVMLVLGPFNFPLHLPGGQIIPALLAGNPVVFKPSEQATAIGLWMVDAWRHCGLPAEVLQPILGGPDVAMAAIDAPQTAGVCLTGSRAAGHAIHRRLAGRPQVLLALELGGNNPIVVTETAPPQAVASVVSYSAFVSAGQRCTCARRVIFVESSSAEAQLAALLDRTRNLRVGLPETSPAAQIGPLISAAAVDRLQATYRELIALGCQPLVPWQRSPASACVVHPAVLAADSLTESSRRRLGELEWFGPLLVTQREPDLAAAIGAAANTPYGLAAALLGGTAAMFDEFVDGVGAGVVNWNGPTTGAAGDLPFGGLGDSGNHRPAGFFAIDFCNDPVASLLRAEPGTDDLWSVAE